MNHYLNRPLMMDLRFVAQFMNNPDVAASIFGEREACESELEDDAIRTIRVVGSIWQRDWWNSYERIERQFLAAQEDDAVKGIVFDLATPGGDVHGTFDLADLIYEARGNKPTLAIVNELAASAGFAIASSCDEIVMPRTGKVGSVGVITMHWDDSKYFKERGMKPTLIFHGDHKADSNPYEPLPAEVETRIRADIEKPYEIFVDTVARNRGISTQQVRDSQALVYTGEDAVAAGFADSIMPARKALALFKEKLTGNRSIEMKIKAKELKTNLTALGVTEEQLAQMKIPDDDSEVELSAELVAQMTGLKAAAEVPADKTVADSDMTDRQRIQAITQSEHAEGRKAMAEQLAFETDTPASAAIAVLEKAPKAAAPVADQKAETSEFFTQLLKEFGSQGIDSDRSDPNGGASAQTEAEKVTASILASHNLATGRKPEAA